MMSIKKIGIIGSGTMGNGIAHVSALHGFQTVLLDLNQTILNVAFIDKYLSKADKQKFIDHVKKLHKSIYPFKNGLSRLYHLLQILTNCFKPSHQGWGSVDSSNHLGSRKKGFFWF